MSHIFKHDILYTEKLAGNLSMGQNLVNLWKKIVLTISYDILGVLLCITAVGCHQLRVVFRKTNNSHWRFWAAVIFRVKWLIQVDCEDDYRSGYSDHYMILKCNIVETSVTNKSFWRLFSPRRSHKTNNWYSQVQTIYQQKKDVIQVLLWSPSVSQYKWLGDILPLQS